MGASSLWPDFVHKKPSQTFQKLSFEGRSRVQLPPLGARAGVVTVVWSPIPEALCFFERKNWWAKIKELLTLNCQFFDENPPIP